MGVRPGLYRHNGVLESEGLLYPLDCALGYAGYLCCVADRLSKFEIADDRLVLYLQAILGLYSTTLWFPGSSSITEPFVPTRS